MVGGIVLINQANLDVKTAIRRFKLTQAQVAKEMDISYSYFTTLLQTPINPQRKRQAIERLVQKRTDDQAKEMKIMRPKEDIIIENQNKIMKKLDEIAYYLVAESRRDLDNNEEN